MHAAYRTVKNSCTCTPLAQTQRSELGIGTVPSVHKTSTLQLLIPDCFGKI